MIEKNGDGIDELIIVTPTNHLRIYSFSKENFDSYSVSSESAYKDVSLLANAQLRSSRIDVRE